MDDADSLLSSVADVDLLANGLGAKTCPAGLAPLGNFTSAARFATHVPAAILHSKQWQRLLNIPQCPQLLQTQSRACQDAQTSKEILIVLPSPSAKPLQASRLGAHASSVGPRSISATFAIPALAVSLAASLHSFVISAALEGLCALSSQQQLNHSRTVRIPTNSENSGRLNYQYDSRISQRSAVRVD